MAERLSKFCAHLEERGVEAALISIPQHIFYLSGFLPPSKVPSCPYYYFLLVCGGRAELVLPQSDVELAEARAPDVELAPYEDYSIQRRISWAENALGMLLKVAFPQLDGAKLGIEADSLPVYFQEALARNTHLDALGSILPSMRMCKDAEELEAIRAAVSAADIGFQVASRTIRSGATEFEVYVAIKRGMELAVGEPIELNGDFVSGPRTEAIGGPPTHRRLGWGEVFLIDMYPRVRGYCGDITRNFVVGKASPEQRRLHSALEEALNRGVEAIRPGVRACELYQVVRDSLEEAGHLDHFPHHAGHGIGLFVPEAPYLIPADSTPLAEGMVITLEPGIYIPDFGGMRLEGNYVVTAEGGEALSRFPYRLIECL